MEGWLLGVEPCQGSLCPCTTLEIQDDKGWVGRRREKGFQGEKLGVLLPLPRENRIFHAETWLLMAHMGCSWISKMGIRNLPWPELLVSSSRRGKELLIGKYWTPCKYFTPLRCQWQILCGILCMRWWFGDGKKRGSDLNMGDTVKKV